MVTVGMDYQVAPDKNETFESKFAAVVEAMTTMDGHTDTRLFRAVTDSQSYLVISVWDSEDAFNAFVSSDEFRNVTNWGTENVLVARPHHTMYRH